MTGVNDLADEWRETASQHELNNPHGLKLDASARQDCASDLDGLREDVWKPSSEPPTEADGDGWGRVVIKFGNNIQTVTAQHAADACIEGMADYWARIDDAVLLPGDT